MDTEYILEVWYERITMFNKCELQDCVRAFLMYRERSVDPLQPFTDNEFTGLEGRFYSGQNTKLSLTLLRGIWWEAPQVDINSPVFKKKKLNESS